MNLLHDIQDVHLVTWGGKYQHSEAQERTGAGNKNYISAVQCVFLSVRWAALRFVGARLSQCAVGTEAML